MAKNRASSSLSLNAMQLCKQSLSPQHFHLDGAIAAAVDELVDVGVAAVVDSLGGTLPDDLALVDHGDFIGDFAGRGHVVGDGDCGGAQALHAIHNQIVDDVGHDGIKTRGRLIEENDFGISGNGAGEANALLHAAGKLSGIKRAHIRAQANLAEFLHGDVFCLGPGHVAPLDQAEGDIFPNGERVKQGSTLKQHAEPSEILVACGTLEANHFLATHRDGTGFGMQDSEHAFQHDGLARARTADDHQRAPLWHRQVQAIQDMLCPEAFADVLQNNVSLSHGLIRKQQGGEDEIGGENENGGRDDGIGGCPANTLGAAFGIEAVIAAHDGDDEAEDGGLDEA